MVSCFTLPSYIDEDFWKSFKDFTKVVAPHPFTLVCDGDGGDLLITFDFIDLLSQYQTVFSPITAFIKNHALSCHSLIFFACKFHYTLPDSYIYLHNPVINDPDNFSYCFEQFVNKKFSTLIPSSFSLPFPPRGVSLTANDLKSFLPDLNFSFPPHFQPF
jgi:hypothetical protein